jgi:hypothetical protein
MGMIAETQSSIPIFCLLIKENKCSFYVSVCSKQTEVFRFHFPFAENKQKLLFSICGIPEMWTWRHGDGDMEAWRHRDMETWRHRNIKNMDMETPNRKRKLEAQVIF